MQQLLLVQLSLPQTCGVEVGASTLHPWASGHPSSSRRDTCMHPHACTPGLLQLHLQSLHRRTTRGQHTTGGSGQN